MQTKQFFAQVLIAIVSTVCSAFAQDSAKNNTETGTLAVQDLPDSLTRVVLFASGAGEPSMATRAQLEADAKAVGKTITWIPVPKAQFEQELRRVVGENPRLDGVEVKRTSFSFSDAENVDVLLDISLSSKSQEEHLINAANDVIVELMGGRKPHFGARPADVTLSTPDSETTLKAINDDLAKAELRLSGCTMSGVTFSRDADTLSTVVEGTVAFAFQTDAVIASIQETLATLSLEDWLEVRPVDSGFKVQPPDLTPYVAELRETLQKNDATVLKVILCDASLVPNKDAPGQMEVNLNGYISTIAMEELVVEIANQISTSFFSPYLTTDKDTPSINVVPTELTLKTTSRSASKQFIRLAHGYVQEHRTQDALNSFELAAFEDKRSMETMYWLAITQLRANDDDAARKTLRVAVRENAKLMEEARSGSINRYADMMHTLESVQGRLRQRLHEQEGKVYAEYCKAQNIARLPRR